MKVGFFNPFVTVSRSGDRDCFCWFVVVSCKWVERGMVLLREFRRGLLLGMMGRLLRDVRVCVIPILHYDGSLLKCLLVLFC